ncbi:hypothetical protein P43SY_001730 [Pythium insidiosum]|uniref:MORN repeat-containing protein n=1 Tax=Pythium insidiosum TaxID=114742 RepID=A0AAD5LF36_PYTIN|nr:hypothetical protein P43SY_001730 [Pythium insidiosum]
MPKANSYGYKPPPKQSGVAAAVAKWRRRVKPKDARRLFLLDIQKKDREEKQRLHDELVRLMGQINTLLQKEKRVVNTYERKHPHEDPRSVFYYRMLRRIGLPEIHARFAPWFLKSHQLPLSRWSAVLFARLEQAFFALPEQLTTLEQRMREHQAEYDAIMKRGQHGSNEQLNDRNEDAGENEYGDARRPLQPREQNQLLLQRAFRDCSFFQEDRRRRRVGPKRRVPILQDQDVDVTQAEIDKLELIPEVSVASTPPPGLAPVVRGQLESHGRHVYFTYNGRWKDGEMQGPLGVYTFADGGKYRGEWRHSEPSGAGVVIYPNGVKYTGSFRHGRFHGFGVMEMERGYRYEGEFRDGQRCGQGTLLLLTSGTRYDGEFYANMRHGKGVETNSLGFAYSGQWASNRMCGPGRLLLPDKTEVFREQWPMCVLGEAIRMVKRERRDAEEREERWYRGLLRVRDDLRALDLQYAWWDKEAERLEREEEQRIMNLKLARKEKREAESAAKQAFLEQKLRDQEPDSDEKDSDDDEEDDEEEEEEEEEKDQGEEEKEENGEGDENPEDNEPETPDKQ